MQILSTDRDNDAKVESQVCTLRRVGCLKRRTITPAAKNKDVDPFYYICLTVNGKGFGYFDDLQRYSPEDLSARS